jgi:mono/diheme cytochrome c family protein
MKYLPFALLLLACGKPDPRVEDILALEGEATSGEALYSANCSSCHGADASGGSGPNLIEEVEEGEQEEMIEVILEGEGEMPSFSDLEDQDIADILAWIESQA